MCRFSPGSDVTIADFAISAGPGGHERHMVDLNSFPNVKRWYETMIVATGRPARLRVRYQDAAQLRLSQLFAILCALMCV